MSIFAFATLILIALMMGSNHVAARFAFNDGVNVASAVLFRGLLTALVLFIILRWRGVKLNVSARSKRAMPVIGILIGLQSLCLYSAVARLPVAIALLAFNTYPIWAAIWDKLIYQRSVPRATLLALPVILGGLALALNVSEFFNAANSASVVNYFKGNQLAGLFFALTAAAVFALAMVLTQGETMDVDGMVRSFSTLLISGLVALAVVIYQGGFSVPKSSQGWVGLLALAFLYGTAFTIMVTVLPRLGVAKNLAIINVEPIFALVLAWIVLGQSIAPVQVLGGVLVVASVIYLGLRKA